MYFGFEMGLRVASASFVGLAMTDMELCFEMGLKVASALRASQ
jgi:hypothetical protein